MWDHSENTALCEPGIGLSPDTGSVHASILDLQPSEQWEIHFCCLQATRSMVLCYGGPSGLRQGRTHGDRRCQTSKWECGRCVQGPWGAVHWSSIGKRKSSKNQVLGGNEGSDHLTCDTSVSLRNPARFGAEGDMTRQKPPAHQTLWPSTSRNEIFERNLISRIDINQLSSVSSSFVEPGPPLKHLVSSWHPLLLHLWESTEAPRLG